MLPGSGRVRKNLVLDHAFGEDVALVPADRIPAHLASLAAKYSDKARAYLLGRTENNLQIQVILIGLFTITHAP